MRRNQQKEERIFFVLRALEITISLKKGTETARLIPFAGSLERVPFAFDIDDFAILDQAAEYRKKERVLEVLGAVGTVVFASRNTDSVINLHGAETPRLASGRKRHFLLSHKN